MKLVWSNCLEYNDESTLIHQYAIELEDMSCDLFHERVMSADRFVVFKDSGDNENSNENFRDNDQEEEEEDFEEKGGNVDDNYDEAEMEEEEEEVVGAAEYESDYGEEEEF